ncbi:MAG: phosphoribosyltransferase family protein [Oscillospiraceae bacterium]|nr:phosphoribosyltransferase family protein [Oscillospiraceae bacterium]
MRALLNFAGWLQRLIFPPRCIFCSEVVSVPGVCCKCQPVKQETLLAQPKLLPQNYCLTFIDAAYSVFNYTKPQVRRSMQRFKFYADRSMAEGYAAEMTTLLRQIQQAYKIDALVAVPWHKGDRQNRAYHAAQVLAKSVSLQLKVPYLQNSLQKTVKTKRQHTLRLQDRAQNIKNVFKVKDSLQISDKVILLLDDIITTGNTVNACAQALKEAGAVKVIAISFTASTNYNFFTGGSTYGTK